MDSRLKGFKGPNRVRLTWMSNNPKKIALIINNLTFLEISRARSHSNEQFEMDSLSISLAELGNSRFMDIEEKSHTLSLVNSFKSGKPRFADDESVGTEESVNINCTQLQNQLVLAFSEIKCLKIELTTYRKAHIALESKVGKYKDRYEVTRQKLKAERERNDVLRRKIAKFETERSQAQEGKGSAPKQDPSEPQSCPSLKIDPCNKFPKETVNTTTDTEDTNVKIIEAEPLGEDSVDDNTIHQILDFFEKKNKYVHTNRKRAEFSDSCICSISTGFVKKCNCSVQCLKTQSEKNQGGQDNEEWKTERINVNILERIEPCCDTPKTKSKNRGRVQTTAKLCDATIDKKVSKTTTPSEHDDVIKKQRDWILNYKIFRRNTSPIQTGLCYDSDAGPVLL